MESSLRFLGPECEADAILLLILVLILPLERVSCCVQPMSQGNHGLWPVARLEIFLCFKIDEIDWPIASPVGVVPLLAGTATGTDV